MYLHEEDTRYTSVRSKAGNIVVESCWDVEADVVCDSKEQAVATEASIGTEEDVAVCILMEV